MLNLIFANYEWYRMKRGGTWYQYQNRKTDKIKWSRTGNEKRMKGYIKLQRMHYEIRIL